MTDSVRVNSRVKWYNTGKAFGFLIADGFAKDIFVHRSQMVKSGIESLIEDERVSCIVRDGPKGLFAIDIQREK